MNKQTTGYSVVIVGSLDADREDEIGRFLRGRYTPPLEKQSLLGVDFPEVDRNGKST